jgi:hypothetical protein
LERYHWSLTVLDLPSGCEGVAVDFDLLDQEQEELLVTVGGPLVTHVDRVRAEVLGVWWVGSQVAGEKVRGRVREDEWVRCCAQVEL